MGKSSKPQRFVHRVPDYGVSGCISATFGKKKGEADDGKFIELEGLGMAYTFFKVLAFLEKQDLEQKLADSAGRLLRRLVVSMEEGYCSSSGTDRFIMGNFRLRSGDMAAKWNRLHPDREKKPETMRGQVSLLSRYLCTLFSVTPDELGEAFINNETGRLGYISGILYALEMEAAGIREKYALVAAGGFFPPGVAASAYDIRECTKEIQLLGRLDRDTVLSMAGGADADKLAYVWQSLMEPLVTDIYVKPEDRVRKVRTASVNRRKLELCRALAEAAPKDSHGVSGYGKEKQEEGIPYQMSFDRRLSDILREREGDRMTVEETAAWLGMSEGERDAYRRRLANFLYVFTEEGFRRQLAHYNPIVLREVLDGDYRQADGKAGHRFRR